MVFCSHDDGDGQLDCDDQDCMDMDECLADAESSEQQQQQQQQIEPGERPAARVNELKRRSRQFVAQCLQDAADSGAMVSGVTVNGATIVVLGAILAVGHAKTRVADESERERLTTEVWIAIVKMRHEPSRYNQPQRGGHSR